MPLPSDNARGQAALLLVESLIHELVATGVLSTQSAVDIIEAAISVQGEVAEAADGAGQEMWRAHSLLSTMADSLRFDLNDPNIH